MQSSSWLSSWISSVALLALVACSSTSSATPTGGGGSSDPKAQTCGAGGTGVTQCLKGALDCQAGQYCDTSNLSCQPGCTSDTNCAQGEECRRASGASVGACSKCVVAATAPPTPTRDGRSGTSGTCKGDGECPSDPGLLHEVCSGGFCTPGCRKDPDCGNDFVCDTSVAVPPQCAPRQ